MPSTKKYNLPFGYTFLQTGVKSNDFLQNPIAFITRSMANFGDTYTARLGWSKRIILTQDPGFINYILKENHRNFAKSELATKRAVQFFGNGLLFANGEYWLRQRRLIQPAFHKEKLQSLFGTMIASINEDLTSFPTGDSIDIYPLIHQLSFNTLIRSLFEIRLSKETMEELGTIFTELQDFLIRDINQPFRRLAYPFSGEKKKKLKKAVRLRAIFRQIVEERQQSTDEFNDLLEMLLKSRYEDSGEGMTDEQIIDELLIMLFAGHETTANTLTWLLYLLAANSEELDQLRESLRPLSIEGSMANSYLRAGIHEAMRLYPAAWMTERVTLEDDHFGNYSFPAGTIIIPFFYGLHRNKMLWPDVNDFKPQRFIDDPKLERSTGYFPFGAGPRMCIGSNFAMTEMAFVVYAFLGKFDFELAGDVPQMRPLITLRPDRVTMTISKRG